MGLTTENASLKQQNVLLDKRQKELNEINQKLDKELIELKKEKQKLEADHKKLRQNMEIAYLIFHVKTNCPFHGEQN